jgi:hypothetical protein
MYMTTFDNEQGQDVRMLYGVVDLEEPIFCSNDILGHREPISIAGVSGYMEFPDYPDWGLKPEDPIHTPLQPPKSAREWKYGSDPILWGMPLSYPLKVSRIERVLVEFSMDADELTQAANSVRKSFFDWRTRFIEYFELITKQRRHKKIYVVGSVDGLDLFCWNEQNKVERPYDNNPTAFKYVVSLEDTNLTNDKLAQICSYCNSGKSLSLEYRLQLESYRAMRIGDYRKAIIETAMAAELVLTKAIRSNLISSGVPYGEKLLKKFRMLSGRFELARIVGVSIPDRDYTNLLVEPRNLVVHQADFADEHKAITAINVVDELLVSLATCLSE